jgi:hypothetical protein
MTDETTQTAAAPSAASITLADLKAFGEQLLSQFEPIAEAAVKKIIGDVVPAPFGAIADVAVDGIDMLIHKLEGSTNNAVASPAAKPSLLDRTSALEAHVAALTVATGNSTAAGFAAAKAVAISHAATAARE